MKIVYFILFISVLFSCEYDDIDNDPNAGLYTPYVLSIRDDEKVTLRWGRPGCMECGTCSCPSAQPDHFEVLMSDSNPYSMRHVATINNSTFETVIANLTNDKPYYFAVKAVKPGKEATVSASIMTIPDEPEDVQPLFEIIQANRQFGTWSPDGSLVAYVSDYSWNNGNNSVQSLFIHRLASDEVWLVEMGARSPHWSPTGNRIVYHTDHGEANTSTGYRPTHIAVLDIRDSTTRRLTEGNSFNYLPTWSPDESWIAFLSDRSGTNEYNVWKVRSDGADIIQLTSDFNDLNELAIKDDRSPKNLAWSPDGNNIAFARLTKFNNSYNADIYSLSITGGIPENVVSSPWRDVSPAYSPDGTLIAFVSDRSGSNQIWTMDLHTKKLRQITGSTEKLVYENSGKIEWSSAGNKILYSANANDFYTLYAVDVNID